MADTPKLTIPEIAESQAAKYSTHNDGLRILDCLVQLSVIDKDLSEPPGSESDGDTYIVGSTSSSSSDWNGYDDYIAYYKSSAYIYIEPVEGLRAWVVDEAQFYVYQSASDGWVTEASISAEKFTDLNDTPVSYSGKAYNIARVNSGETALEFEENKYDICAFFNDKPTASQVLLRMPFVRAVRFADDLAGSELKAGVAATAEAIFSIKKDGVEFATATVAIAGTTATFDTASGLESFAAGDILTIVAPGTQDSTLSSVGITLKGVMA